MTGSTTTATSTSTSTSTGVTTPSPTQSGMVKNCNKFYEVQSGDGCYNIAQAQGIPLDSLYAWNPAVKTDCSGLQANVYICIGVASSSAPTATTSITTQAPPGVVTPTPVQSGIVGDCDKFYDVASGDGCYNIASAEGIPLASFYQWNPAIKTDCSGLQASVYVCVGVATQNAARAGVTPS